MKERIHKALKLISFNISSRLHKATFSGERCFLTQSKKMKKVMFENQGNLLFFLSLFVNRDITININQKTAILNENEYKLAKERYNIIDA